MAMLGESIDPRLSRLDPQVFKSIESAGAATGAMYANLGEAAGMTIEKIQQNKRTEEAYDKLKGVSHVISKYTGMPVALVDAQIETVRHDPEALQNMFGTYYSEAQKAGHRRDEQDVRLDHMAKMAGFQHAADVQMQDTAFSHQLLRDKEGYDQEDQIQKMDHNFRYAFQENELQFKKDHAATLHKFDLNTLDKGFAHRRELQNDKFGFENAQRIGSEEFALRKIDKGQEDALEQMEAEAGYRLNEKIKDQEWRKGMSEDEQEAAIYLLRLDNQLKFSSDSEILAQKSTLNERFLRLQSQVQTDATIREAETIARLHYVVEREQLARRNEDARRLTDEYIALAEERPKDFDEQLVLLQGRFADHNLQIPDFDHLVFSQDDLAHKMHTGDWHTGLVPSVWMNAEATGNPSETERLQHWGYYVLASQGRYDEDQGKNDEMISDLRKLYKIEPGLLGGTMRGINILATRAIHSQGLYGMFKNPINLIDKQFRQKYNVEPGLLQPPAIKTIEGDDIDRQESLFNIRD